MADQTINVVVYGARGLKGKKKGNVIRCNFSVIFGVGKNKFRTEIVEDQGGAPEWNTQSEIIAENNKNPLLMVVTEKDNVLGQITVPLHELPTIPTRQRIVTALEPHKKCPEPSGELIYCAYISGKSNAEPGSLTPVAKKKGFAGSMENFGKPLKKIKDKLSHSPMLKRKLSIKRSSDIDFESDSEDRDSIASLNSLASSHSLSSQKSSVSMQDLSKAHASPVLSGAHRGRETPPTTPKARLKGAASMSVLTVPGTMSHRRASSYDLDNQLLPEVSGIRPKEGPIEGGTRLTIRGANLGKNKADVVGLFVCGSNILASVEYESPSKLFCTTKPWKPCTGNIVIETQSGGKGTSLVQFTFTEPPPPEPDVDVSNPPPDLSIITPPPKPKRKGKENKDTPAFMDLTKPTALPEETAAVITKHRRSGSTASANSATLIPPPEVSGISPREGPIEGGTRLTIRGCNLGNCKEDVIGLFVCGCNCLASLEYDSPSKIFCTTRAWKPGSGSIVIETQGGGRGSSLVEFKFIEPPPAPVVIEKPSPASTAASPENKPQNKTEPSPKQTPPSSNTAPTSNVAVVPPLGSTNNSLAPSNQGSRFYISSPTPSTGSQEQTATSGSNPFEENSNPNPFEDSSNPFESTVPANPFASDETDNQFRAIPFEPDPPASQPPQPPQPDPFSRRVTSKPPKGPAPKPPGQQNQQNQQNNQQHQSYQLPAPVMVSINDDGPSDKELMYKQRCEQLEASNALLKDQVQVLRMENKVMRDSNDSMNQYIERLVAIVMEKCPECLNRDISTTHLSHSDC